MNNAAPGRGKPEELKRLFPLLPLPSSVTFPPLSSPSSSLELLESEESFSLSLFFIFSVKLSSFDAAGFDEMAGFDVLLLACDVRVSPGVSFDLPSSDGPDGKAGVGVGVFSSAGFRTPVTSLLYVCFLTTFLSTFASLSDPSFGYIFRRAGGVCTLGINDLISADAGETGPDEPCPDDMDDFPCTFKLLGFFL